MIYDCFLYYDEAMLLELRLHTLHQHVDKFVIVESTHTFTGKKKALHFDITRFAAFADRIIYVVFDEPPHSEAWENERRTRNHIMAGLKQAQDDDLILVSDVDEIIDPQQLARANPRALCNTFHLNFYNYQFNLQVFNDNGSPRKCTLVKMTRFGTLRDFFAGKPEDLRNVKRSAIKRSWWRWNYLKWRTTIVNDAGWHFSWLMTPERIAEKMSSISHTEYDLPELNNAQHIEQAVREGKDIWKRDRSLRLIPLTHDSFPAHLVQHPEKYADFIRQSGE